jgi:hypothetical protein
MTITDKTANLCMDAMAFALAKMVISLGVAPDNVDDFAAYLESLTRGYFVEFCENLNITDVEETAEVPLDMFEDVEDEEPDFPDDVDETNYDPYMGCDFFETCDCDEGW